MHAQPLVLSGNPSTWGAAQAAEITLGSGFGFGGDLASISCTSATQCTAGGTDHRSQPLVLSGNPATWTAAQAREIALGVAFGSTLRISAISCATSSQCTALGNDTKNEPLALSGNPATWTAAQARLVTLSATFGGSGYATSIDCTTGVQCTAVGYGTHQVLFNLNGNPAGWTNGSVHPILIKGAAFGVVTRLSGLSCPSATTCVAVGRDRIGNPLVIVGNPLKWGTAKATNIPLAANVGEGGSFISVACTAPTWCTAVGFDDKFQPLVIHGNPATWGASSARQLTLSAKFGMGGSLNSVACPTPTLCVAVGTDNVGQLLLLRGNPANWGVAELKGLSLPAKLGLSGQLQRDLVHDRDCLRDGRQ